MVAIIAFALSVFIFWLTGVTNNEYDRKKKINISLCVPCVRSHIVYLPGFIRNVSNQKRAPDEVVIALSGVSDATSKSLEKKLRQIAKYLFSVRVLGTSDHLSAGANRNRAAVNSKGDIISFMDADDVMNKNRIEIIESEFNAHPSASIILHSYSLKSHEEKLTTVKVLGPDRMREIHKDSPPSGPLMIDPPVHHGHVSLRKKVIQKWKQNEKMFRSQDTEYVRRLIEIGLDTIFVPSKLVHYRFENSSRKHTYNTDIIVSMSLWGNSMCYTYGVIENIITMQEHLPLCRFVIYIDDSVSNDIVNIINSFDNVKVKYKRGKKSTGGMFWRFEPAFEEDGVVIVRDADSRITEREVLAIEEWLSSSKSFHIIRDNEEHTFPIMGGMWGVRGGLLKKHAKLLESAVKGSYYGNDQIFLRDVVYPLVKKDSIVHTSIKNRKGEYSKKLRKLSEKDSHIGQINCSTPNANKLMDIQNDGNINKRMWIER